MTREVRWWISTSAAPAGERRDERLNTARGSMSEPNRRAETLANPSAEEDWQEMSTLTLVCTSNATPNESRCDVHD
jgi:hypothetical protein